RLVAGGGVVLEVMHKEILELLGGLELYAFESVEFLLDGLPCLVGLVGDEKQKRLRAASAMPAT
ncbi:MAG: hypothetical protein IIV56_03820, partial [Mailhella sp.]|nr:hypothetical protein [Mailhella sp.]